MALCLLIYITALSLLYCWLSGPALFLFSLSALEELLGARLLDDDVASAVAGLCGWEKAARAPPTPDGRSSGASYTPIDVNQLEMAPAFAPLIHVLLLSNVLMDRFLLFLCIFSDVSRDDASTCG